MLHMTWIPRVFLALLLPAASLAPQSGSGSGGGGGGGNTFVLTVNHAGTGSGTVTSSPAGIQCGSTCSAPFRSGATVTLTASPAAGSVFAGWSGAITGLGSGIVSMTANKSVTATFNSAGVGPAPLTITTTTLPDGNLGANYTAFITSSGGFGSPDQFSVIAGALPDGLTMASSFGVQSTVVTGRPTRVQTSAFTVLVRDLNGTATRTFTITINGPTPVAITLPGPTAAPGTVGAAYLQNLFASGGSTPYRWSVTGILPPGLTLVAANNGNRITGTPTTRGTFSFTLTVRDQAGAQTSQLTSITIN